MTKLLTVLLGSFFAAGVALAGASTFDPPAAEAATGGYAAKCGGGKIFLHADERQSLYLHNRVRKNHNLRVFCVHPDLQRAARAHSKDMIRRDYFSHSTKGRDESACERVRRFGYGFRFCGENIAWGSGTQGSPASVMRRWMNSSGHRRNILDGKFREIGIGTYTGNFKGRDNATMYTADFGQR